jgi:hypothetical protein
MIEKELKSHDDVIPTRYLWLLVTMFLSLGCVYWMKGLRTLLFTPAGGADLLRRWTESRYILQGKDPMQITTGLISPDPMLGLPDAPNYPPWSFLFSLLFTWPDLSIVRWYYALLQIALIGALLLIIWRLIDCVGQEGRVRVGRMEKVLLLSAIFAIGAICTNTGTGNYALLIATLLAASLLYLIVAPQHSWRSDLVMSLLLALAMLKPNITVPFAFSFIFLRRWHVLVLTSLWVALASVVIWRIVNVDPVTMLVEMLQMGQAQQEVPESFTYWMGKVVPTKGITAITAIVVLCCTLPMIAWASQRDLLLTFSIAAIAGRLWAYHRTYDDIMLLFPLLLLGILGFGRPVNGYSRLLFFLFGMTLWIPASFLTKFELLKPLFLAFWFCCVFVIYRITKGRIEDTSLTKPQVIPATVSGATGNSSRL